MLLPLLRRTELRTELPTEKIKDWLLLATEEDLDIFGDSESTHKSKLGSLSAKLDETTDRIKEIKKKLPPFSSEFTDLTASREAVCKTWITYFAVGKKKEGREQLEIWMRLNREVMDSLNKLKQQWDR